MYMYECVYYNTHMRDTVTHQEHGIQRILVLTVGTGYLKMSLFSWLKNEGATSLSSPRDNLNAITIAVNGSLRLKQLVVIAGTVSRQHVHVNSLLTCA